MATWSEESERILEERAGAWETLAVGNTQEERDLAAILRSIVRDIEGPNPADWKEIVPVLEWVLKTGRQLVGGSTRIYVGDPPGMDTWDTSDNTTWVPDVPWSHTSHT